MDRDHELVPRSRGLRLAESEKTAQPGELVIVDARGHVLTKRDRQLTVRRVGVVFGVAIGMAIVASGGAALIPALVTFPILVGSFALWRHRVVLPIARAQSLLLEGDLDGAEAVLSRASRRARGQGVRWRASV